MDDKPSLPESDLHDLLLDASKRQSTRTVLFHQAVAARLGLHVTDHKCLDLVLAMNQATAGQLAKLTGLTTGAITSVINRLEKAGYVRRVKDPKDLRVVFVEPVYENLASLRDIFGPLGDAMNKLYARYDQHQLETILDYIERSNHIIDQHTRRLRNTSDHSG